MSSNNIINLLWSGGWDSTFRLLYILLVKREKVRPYYIIYTTRHSTLIEIKVMEKLKRELFKLHPETKEFLLPTIFRSQPDIKYNESISQSFKDLLKIVDVGSQYEWLAWFAAEEKLNDIELGFIQRPPGTVAYMLREGSECEDHDCRLREDANNDLRQVFKYYRFPIIQYSKKDMERLSIKHRFNKLMRHTWFCFSPKNGEPCCGCHPCEIRKESDVPFVNLNRILG